MSKSLFSKLNIANLGIITIVKHGTVSFQCMKNVIQNATLLCIETSSIGLVLKSQVPARNSVSIFFTNNNIIKTNMTILQTISPLTTNYNPMTDLGKVINPIK